MASDQINVLALTKYPRLAASSRHRFLDYIPLLAERNVQVASVPLLSERYVKRRLSGERTDYVDVTRSYTSRLIELISRSTHFDVLWIEGELFPRFPAIFERLLQGFGRPFVIDLDDAIFHTYDLHPSWLVRSLLGRKIDVVLGHATAVTAGNDYLADRARLAGARRVAVVPTTVDELAYGMAAHSAGDQLSFGWIGSSYTQHYVQTVGQQLRELCYSLPATLRLIGVEQIDFACPNVVLRPWDEGTQIEEIAHCDIGLAPLFDGPWERGKCGLKAIQYMAAGIPVLAADVGVLPRIVSHGQTGFVYRDGAEFASFARKLASDEKLRMEMGMAGRERVASHFSIRRWAKTVCDLLIEAASRA